MSDRCKDLLAALIEAKQTIDRCALSINYVISDDLGKAIRKTQQIIDSALTATEGDAPANGE